jgi:outer membrane protein TolC
VQLGYLILIAAGPVFPQSLPPSPDRPWHSVDERQIVSEGKSLRRPAFRFESDKTYSLAELIDLAEAHNPETRVAWENARAQAAALGIARSELYPTLSVVALSGVDRSEVPLRRRWNSTTQSLILVLVAAESLRRAREYWRRTSPSTTFTGSSFTRFSRPTIAC